MLNLRIASKNSNSANDALKALGLALVQAKRPIEAVVLSAAPGPAAPKNTAAQ